MKKKLLLTLMLLVAATATMSAQEEAEKTAAPSFEVNMQAYQMDACQYDDDYREIYLMIDFLVSIVNVDADEATIYYRVVEGNGPDEWTEYYGPVMCYSNGWYPTNYVIEAYAQAEGKLMSDVVSTADLEDVTIMPSSNFEYSACVVDGINYYIVHSDYNAPSSETGEVLVCSDFDPKFYTDSYYTGDVVIPEEIVFRDETYSVAGIADYAFYHCGVVSVDIPNTVTSIGSLAFYNCQDLAKVTCRAINPPDTYDSFKGNYYSIDAIYNNATLFVPVESLEAYQSHEEWGKFTHIVPFRGVGPGDINGDGNLAVSDVTNLIDQLLSGDELPAYADVNGDGVVTIKDVTDLIDMLLGGN